MDQVRLDPTAQTLNALGRGNAPAGDEGGDVFSQILDRHLAQRDVQPAPAAQDQPQRLQARKRGGDDDAARTNVAARDSAPARQVIGQRREKSTAQTTTAAATTERPAARGAAKPCDDRNARKSGNATAAAGDQAEPGAEAAAASTVTDESASTGATPSAPAATGSSADQTDSGADDGTADDDADDDTILLTGVDLTTLLAVVAQPQAGADATPALGANGMPVAGGKALQNPLPAALLAAIGQQNAQKTPGQPTTTPATGGLSFGTVIATIAKNPSGATPQATDADQAGDADPLTFDPAAPLEAAKGRSGKDTDPGNAGTGKAKNGTAQNGGNGTATDQPAKTVTAAAIQPARASAAAAWTGNGARNAISETLPVTAGPTVPADAEFASWSQVLGSGSVNGLSGSLSARHAAFLGQLRQNLQSLPAHEQIAVQIQGAMKNGSNRLTVDLHPAELGRVEIKLDVDKDKNVTATVVVDRPATLDLLQRDAKALERALQDAGLQTGSDSLSFSLREGNGQAGGQGQDGQGGPGNGGGTAGSGAAEAANQPARADVVATADGYVDLET